MRFAYTFLHLEKKLELQNWLGSYFFVGFSFYLFFQKLLKHRVADQNKTKNILKNKVL